MARPVKKRTAKSYHRDAEVLNRLRMAIKIDKKLSDEMRYKAIRDLDVFMETLFELTRLAS